MIAGMEITSQQRAFLRGCAQTIDPIVMVGKEGLTTAVCTALDEALSHHELVKLRFQNHKDEVRQISDKLSEATRSLCVAVTGFTAVFYREAQKPEDRRFNLRTLSMR